MWRITTFILALSFPAGQLSASGENTDKAESPPKEYAQTSHKAVGARVMASSTHRGQHGEAARRAVVDGDLSTRWSSEYSEPQEISLFFGKRIDVRRIRIHWENACATKYAVSLSPDGKTWQKAYLFLDLTSEPVPRVDTIRLPGTPAKATKLELISRVRSEWGFSIYEIEVFDSK